MPAELSSIGLPYFHYGPASTQIGIWLLTAISPQIKVSKTRESLDLFPNPKVPEKGSDYLDRVRCQPGTSQPQSQSQSQDWRHHNTTWCRHCFQNRGNCCGGGTCSENLSCDTFHLDQQDSLLACASTSHLSPSNPVATLKQVIKTHVPQNPPVSAPQIHAGRTRWGLHD